MDENRLRFGVGVLVISAIGIGIILTFLFGAFPSVLNRDYTLSVVFPSAEGINPNSPVYRDGVRIGRVSDIELRDQGGVLVTLAMDSTKQLTHRFIPRIGSGNLVTGDSKLEFVAADVAELPPAIQPIISTPFSDGEFLDYGKKSQGLIEMQDELQETFDAIRSAGESIAVAGQSVNELAIEVRDVVNGADSKVDELSAKAIESLDEFQGAMREFRAIVGNPELRQNLEQSMEELPKLIAQAQEAFDSSKETFESFQRVGKQFERVGFVAEETVESAQQTFNNLEQFTEPLADRGEELIVQVMQSLVRFEGALAEVEAFGRTLNHSDGTLKRLIEDEEIYYQVRRTIENIEQASAKIRPILDDVRVFSDKIARDPRELGVRGALGKRPSGAGYK